MHRVLLTLGVRRARNERLCCAGPKEQLKRSARPRRLQRPTGRPYNIPYLCDLSHCVSTGKVAAIPSAIRRIEQPRASDARRSRRQRSEARYRARAPTACQPPADGSSAVFAAVSGSGPARVSPRFADYLATAVPKCSSRCVLPLLRA
jgi:hypothetical protein